MLVNRKSDVVPETVWTNTPNTIYGITPGVTTASAVGFGSNNVSYALLSTKMGTDSTSKFAIPGEWRNNTNAGCPMICDRNRGTPAAPFSSWTPTGWFTKPTGWQGSVGWGDVHTTFETSPILSVTLYGSSVTTSNLWGPATSSNAGMVNPGS
jgi:hypothetical protein